MRRSISQVMTTGLRSPSKVSGGVRNGADAPATDRAGIVGSVTCSDAHTYMPNMSGRMQHAGHGDGGGQCSHAHTDRPIMPEMHASMQGHAGNVPVQSDAAGTHARNLGVIMQAIAEGVSAGMVRALGSVGVLSIGHVCMPSSENSMQQPAAIVRSELAHAHAFVVEPQPAAGCSADHGLHAGRQVYGAYRQQYAASTGRQAHGGVPIRQPAVERCTEPKPAAELQSARSVPVSHVYGALERRNVQYTEARARGGVGLTPGITGEGPTWG